MHWVWEEEAGEGGCGKVSDTLQVSDTNELNNWRLHSHQRDGIDFRTTKILRDRLLAKRFSDFTEIKNQETSRHQEKK